MAYTFTPSYTFALSTHEVIYTSTRLQVKLSSSGQLVFDKDYSKGIAFRCDGNNFQVGTLTADHFLSYSVDLSLSNAQLWLEEKSNANKYIGSNDATDGSIYNIFNINQCPVLLSKSGSNAVMKCPCEGSPCSNGCYQYGI